MGVVLLCCAWAWVSIFGLFGLVSWEWDGLVLCGLLDLVVRVCFKVLESGVGACRVDVTQFF